MTTVSTSTSPIPQVFGREGFVSLFKRIAMMTLAMFAAGVVAVLLSQSEIAIPGLSVIFALGSGLCIWKAMVLGLFFGSYPPGDENAMIRLGLVTFCRTGIPLLVVLVALKYATGLDTALKYMLFMYMIGFFSSLILEVLKLKQVDSLVQQSTLEG